MNWEIVVSILTSLGIFKVVDLLLTYFFKDTLIAKNIEFRKAANRLLERIVESKAGNHEYVFDNKTMGQIYFDIEVINEINEELSKDIRNVFSYPYMIHIMMRLDDYAERIVKYEEELANLEETSIKRLKKIRYLSLFKTKKE